MDGYQVQEAERLRDQNMTMQSKKEAAKLVCALYSWPSRRGISWLYQYKSTIVAVFDSASLSIGHGPGVSATTQCRSTFEHRIQDSPSVDHSSYT